MPIAPPSFARTPHAGAVNTLRWRKLRTPPAPAAAAGPRTCKSARFLHSLYWKHWDARVFRFFVKPVHRSSGKLFYQKKCGFRTCFMITCSAATEHRRWHGAVAARAARAFHLSVRAHAGRRWRCCASLGCRGGERRNAKRIISGGGKPFITLPRRMAENERSISGFLNEY